MHSKLDKELFEGDGKETFKKHEPLMQYILDERVFFIGKKEDDFYLFENCDEYFAVKLTPEVCDNLSLLFNDLSNYIKS